MFFIPVFYNLGFFVGNYFSLKIMSLRGAHSCYLMTRSKIDGMGHLNLSPLFKKLVEDEARLVSLRFSLAELEV